MKYIFFNSPEKSPTLKECQLSSSSFWEPVYMRRWLLPEWDLFSLCQTNGTCNLKVTAPKLLPINDFRQDMGHFRYSSASPSLFTNGDRLSKILRMQVCDSWEQLDAFVQVKLAEIFMAGGSEKRRGPTSVQEGLALPQVGGLCMTCCCLW